MASKRLLGEKSRVSQPTYNAGAWIAIETSMNVKPSKNVLVVTDRNAYNIGDLGIGTNSKARITDAVLEDEKVLSTVHIALGDNTPYVGRHTKSKKQNSSRRKSLSTNRLG